MLLTNLNRHEYKSQYFCFLCSHEVCNYSMISKGTCSCIYAKTNQCDLGVFSFCMTEKILHIYFS